MSQRITPSPELLAEVRARRATGEALIDIELWLFAERGVTASAATVRRWCLDIPRVGAKRTGSKGHSPRIKRAALDAIRAGGRYRETCRRFGLSTGTLWKWMRGVDSVTEGALQ